MQTLDAILTRRSVKSFTNQPIQAENIESLLKAAMHAPSGCNTQPWHFVVLTDRVLLDKTAELSPYAKMACEAPLGILLCADTSIKNFLPVDTALGCVPETFPYDLSAAAQNMLLTAHDLGFGGVWTFLYPLPSVMKVYRDWLKLPENITPFCLLLFGYPKEPHAPHHDRFRQDRVHTNGW